MSPLRVTCLGISLGFVAGIVPELVSVAPYFSGDRGGRKAHDSYHFPYSVSGLPELTKNVPIMIGEVLVLVSH